MQIPEKYYTISYDVVQSKSIVKTWVPKNDR